MRARNHLLDAMRGVAALFVLMFHVGKSIDAGWAPGGYLAVDFFFVLSGFVIAKSYDAQLSVTLSWLQFAAKRLVRLYPIFAAGLVIQLAWVGLLLMTHRGGEMGAMLVAAPFNLLMLPVPIAGVLFPLNVPAWSLFFELVANAAYAAFAFRWQTSVLVVVAAGGAAGIVFGAFQYGEMNIGFDWGTAGFGLARVTFSFVAGMIIARYRIDDPVPRRSAWLLLAGLAACLALPTSPTLRPLLDILLAIVVFPALVWIGTSSELPRAGRSQLAWLGDISYPLYAVHVPLLHILRTFRGKGGIGDAAWAVVCAITMVAVAAVLARYVDPFARRRLSMLLNRRTAPASRLKLR